MKIDGRGGARKGAGRKPKADEIKFIEKLDSHIDPDKAIKVLSNLIKEENLTALKLYLEYRYGKPKETKDITISEIQPLFPDEL